jgi:hypothetical protein
VQIAQFRTGLDAQFAGEDRPCAAVLGERVRPAAGPAQRPHQLAAQPLAQREPVDQGGQLAEQFPVVAPVQLQLDPVLHSDGVPLVQRGGQPPHRRAVDVAECRATPQVEAAAQPGGRPVRLGLGAGREGQLLERQGVQVGVGYRDAVPRGVGQDGPGGQHPAQPGHAGLQLGPRGRRWPVAPHGIDQPVGADDAVRVQEQHGQHDPLPARGDLGVPDGEDAQDPVPHPTECSGPEFFPPGCPEAWNPVRHPGDKVRE